MNQSRMNNSNFEELSLWQKSYCQMEFVRAEDECLPGIKWGDFCELYTPAYWKFQYLLSSKNNNATINHRLGENLIQEIVACLLGGFGLKAEVGLSAFYRMRDRKLIRQGVDFESLLESLKEPLIVDGKSVHYRFPNQKSKFIFKFLNRNDLENIPTSNDLELRKWLLTINGIGLKTASWITRNYMVSENVAIIDIHIFRAGLIAGFFCNDFDIQKDYLLLEKYFIDFCNALKVQPSQMDAIIWQQMKESNLLALKTINQLT